jgi:hypothetical protein
MRSFRKVRKRRPRSHISLPITAQSARTTWLPSGSRCDRGRMFSRSDRGRPVAVVSTRVAEQYWPGQNPLGKTLSPGIL